MIILLVGTGGVGKDTVGAVLREEWGAELMSPTDPMNELLLELDPYIGCPPLRLSHAVQSLGWRGAKDEHPEVRRLGQKVSDAGKNALGPWVWHKALHARILDAIARRRHVVLTSVRLVDEAKYLRREYTFASNPGGVSAWRVTRPGYGPLNDHRTETEAAHIACDERIENDGTIDDLAGKVNDVMLTLTRHG